MTDEPYNGWTNHATWCVHLHLTKTKSVEKHFEELAKACREKASSQQEVKTGVWTSEEAARYTLANSLKTTVESVAAAGCPGDGWVDLLRLDLVTAYLERVDWNAIAVAFLGDS